MFQVFVTPLYTLSDYVYFYIVNNSYFTFYTVSKQLVISRLLSGDLIHLNGWVNESANLLKSEDLYPRHYPPTFRLVFRGKNFHSQSLFSYLLLDSTDTSQGKRFQ